MKKRGKPRPESFEPSPAARRTLDALASAGVDLDVVMSLVCNNLHLTVGQILEVVTTELGINLNREQPYEILRRAAASNRLHYIAPLDSELSVKLLEHHEWLRRARVVRTAAAGDVARHAALLLLEFVEQWEKPDLHIGIAGGGLMAEMVRWWAGFLKEVGTLRLQHLFIHTLVAATDDPRRSPNGFVQWLLDDSLPFKTKFLGLPAPAFLSPAALGALRQMEGVRDAFDHARDLDLVITSAGAHWARGCSGLNHKYRQASPESVRTLEGAGCIGDVLWQPFGPGGPLALDIGVRSWPVALLDLCALPQLVAGGARVMLVLAPCGGDGCGEPKNEILAAILGWRNGVTDLVVDARTAALSLRR